MDSDSNHHLSTTRTNYGVWPVPDSDPDSNYDIKKNWFWPGSLELDYNQSNKKSESNNVS